MFVCVATGSRLPERVCSRVLRDSLRGLRHLHHHGIWHRDLKPDNIALNISGQVKVVDFGAMKVLQDDGDDFTRSFEATRNVGTLCVA